MSKPLETLEEQLDSFDAAARAEALEELIAMADAGIVEVPPPGLAFNLHCHSFYSFNGYGYSPSRLAWLGRKKGLLAMGIVDFDVLDGVDEFLAACKRLRLRVCAGMETRVFIPEFGTRVINSPGEPGISYHMGVGFTRTAVAQTDLLRELKQVAQDRTRGLVARVNTVLHEIELDFETHVLPLTPNGNVTERHVCAAYEQRARDHFDSEEETISYWASVLHVHTEDIGAIYDSRPALQALIRSKTMKAGGVGYVSPDGDEFPRIDRVNAFVKDAGAIPTHTWLDGASPGEEAIEELLDCTMAAGVAAVNIIPDRNWNIANPDQKRIKVAKLNEFVALAEARHLPVIVGTELNAHGLPFVDDFDAPEMKPLHPVFLKGAYILHAHTILQAQAGMGYLSPWAEQHFGSIPEKNAFFEQVGAHTNSANPPAAWQPTPSDLPESVLSSLDA
ncbi:MAG: hypothetical protein HYV27_22915 [Candidatus Hydrogenedentes bacterium]|nr:hypothetical protein [Candidatus Hydrogenedentota bacterium]